MLLHIINSRIAFERHDVEIDDEDYVHEDETQSRWIEVDEVGNKHYFSAYKITQEQPSDCAQLQAYFLRGLEYRYNNLQTIKAELENEYNISPISDNDKDVNQTPDNTGEGVLSSLGLSLDFFIRFIWLIKAQNIKLYSSKIMKYHILASASQIYNAAFIFLNQLIDEFFLIKFKT